MEVIWNIKVIRRGPKIALRAKVNDSLITGLRIVDSCLCIGRGQRQLILGDRYTGKTSIFLSLLISSSSSNTIGTINGFGTSRIFGIYIGISQNLSKLSSIIYTLNSIGIISYNIIFSSHSSSSAMLSYILPWLGITIAERIRDRGNDCCISFDDLSKHAKSYRQISLILGKIPSRDAYPSDIFNIHSSLLSDTFY